MTLRPNPAATHILLSAKGVEGAFTLCVFDMSGKLILKNVIREISDEGYRLDTSGLPDGLYIARLSGVAGSEMNERFVIMR